LLARHIKEEDTSKHQKQQYLAESKEPTLEIALIPETNNATDPFVKAIQYIFWNLTESQQSRRHLVEERVTNAVALATNRPNSSLSFKRLCAMISTRLTSDKDSKSTMIVDGILKSLIALSRTGDLFVKAQCSIAFLNLSSEAANSVISSSGTLKAIIGNLAQNEPHTPEIQLNCLMSLCSLLNAENCER
jgi:hypothetical protein